ncbi:MAG: hypothetical protein ACRD30_08580 [Bryobacteraceae bacterium]
MKCFTLRRCRVWPTLLALACIPVAIYAQEAGPVSPTPDENAVERTPPGGNRIFGVLPNYRTADASLENTRLTTREKFTIASKDSFDYPLILLSGALAGLSQLADQSPSLGQGVPGFAHRLATNYADQALGNMLTEAVFPMLFHQDPRYFRRGPSYGTKWQRARYALTRVILTKKDSGGTTFNYSEWIGNASATAISNAYYPDSRSAGDNATKLVEQVSIDAVSQVMKEFWPDIRQKFFHKSKN